MHALVGFFSKHIREFKPTHVIFNDPVTMKATAALVSVNKDFCRINIIHTAEQIPFGPFVAGVDGHCLSPRVENELLRGLDGVWSVSKAVQDYAMTYGQLKTEFIVHPALTYLDNETRGMPVIRNNIDKDEIGMVNPCPHKGLAILVALAKQFPNFKFVTWKSWGSRSVHVEQLMALPNVKYVAVFFVSRPVADADCFGPLGLSPPPRIRTRSGTASRSSWLPPSGTRLGASLSPRPSSAAFLSLPRTPAACPRPSLDCPTAFPSGRSRASATRTATTLSLSRTWLLGSRPSRSS